MATSKPNKYWTLVFVFLIAVIVIGSIVVWSKFSHYQPVEISISHPTPQEQLSQIYIGGAVNSPGFYLLKDGDSLETLIRVAGGTTSSADLTGIELCIPDTGEEQQAQKIDINRAEGWLLKALPGIGGTRAQAIITYRERNGPFRNISQLTKVEGIGVTTYENIKHLITVAD